jgi:protein-disulfide isomerase
MKIPRLSPLSLLPSRALPLLLLLCLALLPLSVFAEDTPEVLRPPKGAQIAIVVFQDLQCPQCGRLAPLLAQASRDYKIPLVQHDFPLPQHNWSFEAAVMARYFDTHSKDIGNAFRDSVFAHQLEIIPQNLRAFADKFAAEHKITLPFVVDPDGKLAALVNADRDLGKTLKIVHTPTIWVVCDKRGGKPFVEVEEPQKNLFAIIDEMKKEPEPPAKAVSHPHIR